MAQNLKECAIDEEVTAKLKKFRFRKDQSNAAIIIKIDVETTTVVADKDLADISVNDLQELLPAHEPRYVAYSYSPTHSDGRISYPLILIFINPSGCKPEMQMMYAGSKLRVINAGGFTKIFEIQNLKELTEDWLMDKLAFFR